MYNVDNRSTVLKNAAGFAKREAYIYIYIYIYIYGPVTKWRVGGCTHHFRQFLQQSNM